MQINITEREYHDFILPTANGEKLKLKVPSELRVAELEKILELQLEASKLVKEDYDPNSKQVLEYFDDIFSILTILFSYNNLSKEWLKKNLTIQQAVQITNSFEEIRTFKSPQEVGEKKKSRNQERDLINLRRQIIFLIKFGISLSEIREMYLDQFRMYYDEVVYILELSGEAEKGSYDKLKRVQIDTSAQDMFDFFSARMKKKK